MNASTQITGNTEGILAIIANASQTGFLHILIFMFVCALFWYLRQIAKDREKTRDKRDQEWINHLSLHSQE